MEQRCDCRRSCVLAEGAPRGAASDSTRGCGARCLRNLVLRDCCVATSSRSPRTPAPLPRKIKRRLAPPLMNQHSLRCPFRFLARLRCQLLFGMLLRPQDATGHANIVGDVAYAGEVFDRLFRPALLVSVVHAARESHVAVHHADVDLGRVYQRLVGQGLTNLFANAFVGTAIPLGATSGVVLSLIEL